MSKITQSAKHSISCYFSGEYWYATLNDINGRRANVRKKSPRKVPIGSGKSKDEAIFDMAKEFERQGVDIGLIRRASKSE